MDATAYPRLRCCKTGDEAAVVLILIVVEPGDLARVLSASGIRVGRLHLENWYHVESLWQLTFAHKYGHICIVICLSGKE